MHLSVQAVRVRKTSLEVWSAMINALAFLNVFRDVIAHNQETTVATSTRYSRKVIRDSRIT